MFAKIAFFVIYTVVMNIVEVKFTICGKKDAVFFLKKNDLLCKNLFLKIKNVITISIT